MRLQGMATERPLTHDLFAATLEQLSVRIDRVVISELADETYHARLYLDRDGIEVEIDARPSDALALAVRGAVPIFAAEEVLAQAALGTDPDEEADDDESGVSGRAARVPLETLGGPVVDPRLDMFRDFVNSLDMEKGSGGEGGGRRS
jgi:bifunctional DNase/RNase